jgi:hypothetical protein
MWLAELLGGGVVLVLGAAVVVLSRQLPYHAEYGPGPGFLPFWLGLGLIACAAVILADAGIHRVRSGKFFSAGSVRAALVLLLLAGVILLVPFLGFVLGFGLFTALTMRLAGRHHWALCVIVAVLAALSIRWIFGSWLKIPLPEGILGW